VVRAVEAKSSVEIVVAVRAESGHYRHADFAWGAVFGMIALLLMLYLPQTFELEAFPIFCAAGFVLGAALSVMILPMRRLFVSSKTAHKFTEQGARATFYELGIVRTAHRTGVLIYVSLFERDVVLVPDESVRAAMGEAALAGIGKTLGQKVEWGDVEGFLGAIQQLGPAFAERMPRRHDDIDELESSSFDTPHEEPATPIGPSTSQAAAVAPRHGPVEEVAAIAPGESNAP
jgi:putative membrane protein